MSIESGIFSRLSTDTAITAIVSLRIYPGSYPQGAAMPAITYQMISGPRDYTHSGADGMCNSRFQVNCHAATYLQAVALAKKVRLRLSGESGTWDDTAVETCFLANEGDAYEVDPESEAVSRVGKRLDFTIQYLDASS